MLASKKLTMLDQRIAQLKNDWIGPSTLAAIYGLTLPELERDSIRWGRLQRRPREVIRGDQVSRFALESYFQQRKVLPIKWAAAKLGMAEASLVNAIAALEASGRVDRVRADSGNLLPEDIDRIFIGALPPLQNRIFGKHDDFCRRLHEAISNELGPHLEGPIEPLHCVTARRLHPDDPDFAYAFCVITDAPIGLRYRIWLDFGKPFNLTPDMCSFVAYSENTDLLRHYLMQQAPELPASL
jgi:hypothetical protein